MKLSMSKALAAASMLALMAGAPVAAQAQSTAKPTAASQAEATGKKMEKSAKEASDKADKMGKEMSSKKDMAKGNHAKGMGDNNSGLLYQSRAEAIENSECLRELSEQPGAYGVSDTQPRINYRALYQAAEIFAMHGQEEACEDVVEGMEDLREDNRDRMERADSKDMDEARLRRMETAVPTTELSGGVRASEVIGLSIRNMKDETLGDVEDVILDPKNGSVRYVLVGTGGFLGLGEEWVAVPWKRLKVTRDLDDAYLPVSEEAFEKAPKISDESLRDEANDSWVRDVEAYYEKNIDG